MVKEVKNTTASIHAKLLNLARSRKIPFNLILPRYGIERFLYRLSQSQYRSRFVLKGAMLFSLWSEVPHRSTRDLDLLGYRDAQTDTMAAIFKEICSIKVEDDGLLYDESTIESEEIKALDEYVGTRVTLMAFLGSAKIPLQIDIGIGDAVVPAPEELTYPTLLDQPAPHLYVYHMETVIAEKFHAIVEHGMRNTRMKDYFDLYYLSRKFSCSGERLYNAIHATFSRRGTDVPNELPLGLTMTFSEDELK